MGEQPTVVCLTPLPTSLSMVKFCCVMLIILCKHDLKTASPTSTSLSLSLRQGVDHCGYLTKLDSRLRPGKRRWFVLVGQELRYYRSKEASLGRPRKVINLNSWCKLAVVNDIIFKVCDIIRKPTSTVNELAVEQIEKHWFAQKTMFGGSSLSPFLFFFLSVPHMLLVYPTADDVIADVPSVWSLSSRERRVGPGSEVSSETTFRDSAPPHPPSLLPFSLWLGLHGEWVLSPLLSLVTYLSLLSLLL